MKNIIKYKSRYLNLKYRIKGWAASSDKRSDDEGSDFDRNLACEASPAGKAYDYPESMQPNDIFDDILEDILNDDDLAPFYDASDYIRGILLGEINLLLRDSRNKKIIKRKLIYYYLGVTQVPLFIHRKRRDRLELEVIKKRAISQEEINSIQNDIYSIQKEIRLLEDVLSKWKPPDMDQYSERSITPEYMVVYYKNLKVLSNNKYSIALPH